MQMWWRFSSVKVLPERTVFHCFSGGAGDPAQICAENGWYASFAGPLTYHANAELREALMALPELILVETDAPYLTRCRFVAILMRCGSRLYGSLYGGCALILRRRA